MNRQEKIIRVIEIIEDSLTSHLPYCVPFEYTEEDKKKDTPQFHRKCVREYAEAVNLLSELL